MHTRSHTFNCVGEAVKLDQLAVVLLCYVLSLLYNYDFITTPVV